MSKKLVTLDDEVPLDVPIENLGVHEPDYKELIAFLKAMGFKTLTQRVADKAGIDASQVEADASTSPATKSDRPGWAHRRTGAASACSPAASRSKAGRGFGFGADANLAVRTTY